MENEFEIAGGFTLSLSFAGFTVFGNVYGLSTKRPKSGWMIFAGDTELV